FVENKRGLPDGGRVWTRSRTIIDLEMRRGYCIVYNGRMVPYQLCDGLAISLTACDRPEQSPLRWAFVWMRGSQAADISCAVAFQAAIASENSQFRIELTTLPRI